MRKSSDKLRERSREQAAQGSPSSRKKFADEAVGWASTAMILAAYFANMFGLVSAQDLWYVWLNIIGGVGLATYAFARKDFPLVVVNTVWSVGAIVVLLIVK